MIVFLPLLTSLWTLLSAQAEINTVNTDYPDSRVLRERVNINLYSEVFLRIPHVFYYLLVLLQDT